MLEGELTFWSEATTTSVASGGVVLAPRGLAHTFRNDGDTPARMVVMVTPGGFENFLRAASVPRGAPAAFPPSQGDVDRALAAAPHHGLEFIPANVF